MNETASLSNYDFSEESHIHGDDSMYKEPSFPTRHLRFGTFELDLKGQRLSRDGASIAVQGKPYETLLALLENPGQIVSREVLQNRLWPGTVDIDRGSNLNTTVKVAANSP